jgi:DNA-binding response OmpR family regulator/HPt (histidine-containing phosphotransfer) domain-containing protein
VTDESDLPDLLDQVWRAHRETNLARIDVIERAALALLQGGLDIGARAAAAADAHKLTGVLGTLGWPQGSVLAMEAETALGGNAPVDANRLAEIAVELRRGATARDADRARAPTVPVPAPPSRAQPHRPVEGASKARRRCVLLADPDKRRRRVTALHLGLGGYRVLEVGSMREIPQAARQGIDILVSEAQLEDGSAVAYAMHLRRDPRTGSLPILITTYDRQASPLAARALGEASMLELPAAPSALLDRIGALLAAGISTPPARVAPMSRASATVPDVLLVEDDPVLADLLSSALRYRGHRTEIVSDGRAALERLTHPEARPRLVILDSYLPGLDGVSVLRGLAECGALERTSVIMLTVRSGEAEVLATLRLGAADHVAKPFSLAVLLEKAERLLVPLGARDQIAEDATALAAH